MFKSLGSETLVFARSARRSFYLYSRMNSGDSQKPPKKVLADPDATHRFKLIEKRDVTHDTRLLRFELPKDTVLGYLPGQHLKVIVQDGEKRLSRKYSPTSDFDQKGFFDFVVKVYPESSKFPGGGKMTRFIDSLSIGDLVEMEGPVGRVKYFGNGLISLMFGKGAPETKRTYKHIGMIAGGTGIAPYYQIAKTIASETASPINVKMVFSNHTENDIILRDELDQLAKNSPEKFTIWYTVTRSVLPNWRYDVGHVTLDMLKKHLPPPSDDTLIMICGPPAFIKSHCVPLLIKIGHKRENIFG